MSKSCFRTGKYLFNHIVYTFKTYENSRSYSSLFITNSKLYSSSFIIKWDIAINYINQNFIHSSSVCGVRFDGRHEEGRRALKSRKEETDYVETTFSDNIRGFGQLFPDEETPNQLYNGVKFSDLPIVHIKVSRNNTIILVSDAKGASQLIRTCGMDGFKNAKKGTNVAAQVTAQSIGLKAFEKGMKNVRVCIKGFGPGRMAAVKGLTLGGLNIVSISDVTPISFNITPRPRKARRV